MPDITEMIQIVLAMGVIGWASRVLYRKWLKEEHDCNDDCVTCPSKQAGLCDDSEAQRLQPKGRTSEREANLAQLPSKKREKVSEDHV